MNKRGLFNPAIDVANAVRFLLGFTKTCVSGKTLHSERHKPANYHQILLSGFWERDNKSITVNIVNPTQREEKKVHVLNRNSRWVKF